MTKLLSKLAILGLAMAMGTAHAAPLDLSTWVTNNDLNFVGGQPGGSWTVQAGNEAVVQSINGDPTMFLTGENITNISGLSGTFRETSPDDDFVGFVFGFQDTGSFYLFDWKQGSQFAYGVTGSRGISLKRIDAAPTTHSDLWSTASVAGKTTSLYFNGAIGRSQGVDYTFTLDRDIGTGEISISLSQGATLLDAFTVYDNTYTEGQFGFYNYSEDSVTYSGFQADVFQVPAPAGLLIALLALPMLLARRFTR